MRRVLSLIERTPLVYPDRHTRPTVAPANREPGVRPGSGNTIPATVRTRAEGAATVGNGVRDRAGDGAGEDADTDVGEDRRLGGAETVARADGAATDADGLLAGADDTVLVAAAGVDTAELDTLGVDTLGVDASGVDTAGTVRAVSAVVCCFADDGVSAAPVPSSTTDTARTAPARRRDEIRAHRTRPRTRPTSASTSPAKPTKPSTTPIPSRPSKGAISHQTCAKRKACIGRRAGPAAQGIGVDAAGVIPNSVGVSGKLPPALGRRG